MASRKNADQLQDGTALVTIRSIAAQVVTHRGRTLAEVRAEADGISVTRKRERGGSFDRHFYPWKRVVSFVEGQGGRVLRNNAVAYATVLEHRVLFSVFGVVTRETDGGLVVFEDVGENEPLVQHIVSPDAVLSGNLLVDVAYGAAKPPRGTGDEEQADAEPRRNARGGAARDPDGEQVEENGDESDDGYGSEVVDAFDTDAEAEEAEEAEENGDESDGATRDDPSFYGYEGDAPSTSQDPDSAYDGDFADLDDAGAAPAKPRRGESPRQAPAAPRRPKATSAPVRPAASRAASKKATQPVSAKRAQRNAEPEPRRGSRKNDVASREPAPQGKNKAAAQGRNGGKNAAQGKSKPQRGRAEKPAKSGRRRQDVSWDVPG